MHMHESKGLIHCVLSVKPHFSQGRTIFPILRHGLSVVLDGRVALQQQSMLPATSQGRGGTATLGNDGLEHL
jgi:hypothetical protein